jgi:hypothetical protein
MVRADIGHEQHNLAMMADQSAVGAMMEINKLNTVYQAAAKPP